MTYRSARIGEAGEEMAAAYLAEKGLKIVARRVRLKRGELDIVARNGREWVFVEVKTRSSSHMGTAAEAMTGSKAKRMERAVLQYLEQHNLGDAPVRCDLVTVDFTPDGGADIEHYPGGIVF